MKVGLAGGTLAYRDQELTLCRNGVPEQVWMNLDYSPVPDESGKPAGVIAIVAETTERVLAERRQAFRLALEERLRDLADPREVTRAAAESIGLHMAAVRVGYAEVMDDGQHAAVVGEWIAEGTSSIAGRHRLSDFGPALAADYAAGRTVSVCDFATDPRSAGTPAVAAHAALNIRAQAIVPLIKAGRLAALLFVHFARPRPWSEADLALVEDVAERTWAASERARAEGALRESEEQLRLATQAAEIGLWDVDLTTDTLYWPPRVKAMFGILSDAPVSMADFYAGLHPDDREETTAAFIAALDPASRALYDVEYRTVGKEDGIIRWVAAKGRGVFDAQGRCTRVLGTAIDITRRKADEERLRELYETLEQRVAEALAERKLLADIIDHADVYVQVADLDFRWLAINQAAANEFARIFGVRRPRAGDSMLEILAGQPEQQAAVRAVWVRALRGEEFVETDAFGDPSLDRRHYEMQFRTLRDKDGRAIGAYQFVYDVTDRLREQARLREAEAALRQAQKMEAVGQLTGGIAHDFNNLLQGIAGSLDLIRRKSEDSEKVRRWADGGLQAVERGARLTGQLLAFSRSQLLEVKPLLVAERVAGMHDLLGRTLGPLVTVSLDLADGYVPVLSDPTQLEMALLNLAINARDAMPGGGKLRIQTLARTVTQDPDLEPGEYVELGVSDTGAGMLPEVAARAFDPFFTTKTMRNGQGTGLGLSQVYAFARQSGGIARVETRPGEGTTVRLLLRRTDQDVPHYPVSHEGKQLTGQRPATVLIVDDDADIRRFLAESLRALGYRVEAAVDGTSGLAVLDHLAPDVMVVDYAMPGMNGAEVARAARDRRPDLPIVFASGYSDTAAIESAVGASTPVLRKPFRIDQLHAVIVNVLPPTGVAT